jgi:hypothetical protein
MALTKVDTQLLSNGFTTDSTGLNTISGGSTKILATAAGTANDRKLIFQNEVGTQATLAMGTTGSSGGLNTFYIQTNAGYSINVNASGQVTMPYQVGCVAYLNAGQTNVSGGNGAYRVNLNAVGYNVGSGFNTTTYKFTAPIAGRYLVLGVVEVTGPPTQVHCGIFLNGGTDTSKGLPDQWNQSGYSAAYSSGQSSIYKNVILNLAASDYVELWMYNAGGATSVYANRTTLSISLIG